MGIPVISRLLGTKGIGFVPNPKANGKAPEASKMDSFKMNPDDAKRRYQKMVKSAGHPEDTSFLDQFLDPKSGHKPNQRA